MNIIVVFANRTSTLMFARTLNAVNIPHMVVSTPRAIMRSCGVSCKLDSRYFGVVENILAKNKLNSFVGVYKEIVKQRNIAYIKLR